MLKDMGEGAIVACGDLRLFRTGAGTSWLVRLSSPTAIGYWVPVSTLGAYVREFASGAHEQDPE